MNVTVSFAVHSIIMMLFSFVRPLFSPKPIFYSYLSTFVVTAAYCSCENGAVLLSAKSFTSFLRSQVTNSIIFNIFLILNFAKTLDVVRADFPRLSLIFVILFSLNRFFFYSHWAYLKILLSFWHNWKGCSVGVRTKKMALADPEKSYLLFLVIKNFFLESCY